jgi:two-component system, cell cycle sensor histidine kinase and response regulator CckA
MPDSQRLVQLIRRLAAVAIESMIALAVTMIVLTGLARHAAARVEHTRTVELTAASTLNLARDRQLSINRSLISDDSAMLAVERTARPALERAIDSLTRLTADNPAQQAQLRLISASIAEWNRSYVDPILRTSDARARARLVQEKKAGTPEFSNVVLQFATFERNEEALFTQRARRSAMWAWAQLIVIAIEALFVLFVLVRMRRGLLDYAARMLTQQSLFREQAARLEEQAAERHTITADLEIANHELTESAMEQEALTADLELANHELSEATAEAEESRDAARILEEQYRLLFDRNPAPMWVYDETSLRFLAVNTSAVEHYGYSVAEFLAMGIEDIRTPEDAEIFESSERHPDQLHRSPGWRHRRRDGSLIDVDIVTHSVTFDGRRARIVLALDVTARKLAEVALSESNAILRAVVDDSPLGIVLLSPDLTINKWNRAAAMQFGWSADDAVGKSIYAIIPEERRAELATLLERLDAGEIITNFETQRARHDGTLRDMLVSQGVLHGAKGAITGYVGIYSDVTDNKRLESQLRQAQKMEAVGQLAGGVAHDFNNLLTVIISYSQMLAAEMDEGSTALGDVREIRRAAERAALLTKQLLAFSRQQVLKPHILDLNQVIGDLQQMLRRLLREDIAIVLSLDPALGSVAADPGQIEQIVMNLVVNARDAMQNGGSLSIETANVTFETSYQLRANEAPIEAGRYVMMAVSDSGAGMSQDVQTRVFEPFFTTKPAHLGTGLGLSTVYGIVKQSGGHLAMYSEPDHGTIFKIYLPRVDSVPDRPSDDESAADVSPREGGETLLIVEDDVALRIVACRALHERGYVVLEAVNGLAALQICAQHLGRIDLVVTDMVMPEMSGAELAERIGSTFPDIRVLLMSGYTRDEAARRGIASERYSFLEKPFTPTRLASRVREVLDVISRARQASGPSPQSPAPSTARARPASRNER